MKQHEKILGFIDEFGSITPMEAFADLGITKLSTRIGELARAGVKFDKEMVTGENRYGEPVRYMRYRRAEDDDKSRA